MATKKKMLQAAAGNAGGEALNVEEVFSTYLYTGNGSARSINNGIDLDGEGGLVWIKARSDTSNHYLWDTVSDNVLFSNLTNAGYSTNPSYTALSNGFSILSTGFGLSSNSNSTDYASWTFRKAPKFFDVVTYTGDGVEGRTVSHNLGVAPAFIIIKKTNSSEDWLVGTDFTSTDFKNLKLNTTDAATTQAYASPYNSFAAQPSSTEITLSFVSTVNGSGDTYVAYLFAHNDGDGEFGPDGDADIIKCGSYTGNGSEDGPEIDLGFEPQWFMWKRTDATANWVMIDSMRGISYSDPGDPGLFPNSNSSENPDNNFNLTATGLKCQTNNSDINASGGNYIYIAIRRGTKVPESATEVFEPTDYTGDGTTNRTVGSLTVDMNLIMDRTNTSNLTYNALWDRLRGSDVALETNSTSAESTGWAGTYYNLDQQGGFSNGSNTGYLNSSGSSYISYIWKRAPGYFDAVAYTGNGTAGRTVSHNLGVAPEMIWVKSRNQGSYPWKVYHTAVGAGASLELNSTAAPDTNTVYWNDTAPTESAFSLGTAGNTNGNTEIFIAYLFASLDGVSKLGKFTTTSGDLNVDCGFTSGARFILLKKTNGAEPWTVFDSERGIVSGNDPFLSLNDTAAETTGYDAIDPLSSGFIVRGSFWGSGVEYFFYAIA